MREDRKGSASEGENQQTEMKSKNERGRGRDDGRRTKGEVQGEREWEVCEKENDEGGEEVGVEREGSGKEEYADMKVRGGRRKRKEVQRKVKKTRKR